MPLWFFPNLLAPSFEELDTSPKSVKNLPVFSWNIYYDVSILYLVYRILRHPYLSLTLFSGIGPEKNVKYFPQLSVNNDQVRTAYRTKITWLLGLAEGWYLSVVRNTGFVINISHNTKAKNSFMPPGRVNRLLCVDS